jgi:hypothetical protein
MLGEAWDDLEHLHDARPDDHICSKGMEQNKPLFTEVLILEAWSIWKIRNRAYFIGINPNIPETVIYGSGHILSCRVKETLQSPLKELIALISI